MSDIVERLHTQAKHAREDSLPCFTDAMNEAAEEIERLRGLVDFWAAAAHDRDIMHTKLKEAEQRADAAEKRVKELENAREEESYAP